MANAVASGSTSLYVPTINSINERLSGSSADVKTWVNEEAIRFGTKVADAAVDFMANGYWPHLNAQSWYVAIAVYLQVIERKNLTSEMADLPVEELKKRFFEKLGQAKNDKGQRDVSIAAQSFVTEFIRTRDVDSYITKSPLEFSEQLKALAAQQPQPVVATNSSAQAFAPSVDSTQTVSVGALKVERVGVTPQELAERVKRAKSGDAQQILDATYGLTVSERKEFAGIYLGTTAGDEAFARVQKELHNKLSGRDQLCFDAQWRLNNPIGQLLPRDEMLLALKGWRSDRQRFFQILTHLTGEEWRSIKKELGEKQVAKMFADLEGIVFKGEDGDFGRYVASVLDNLGDKDTFTEKHQFAFNLARSVSVWGTREVNFWRVLQTVLFAGDKDKASRQKDLVEVIQIINTNPLLQSELKNKSFEDYLKKENVYEGNVAFRDLWSAAKEGDRVTFFANSIVLFQDKVLGVDSKRLLATFARLDNTEVKDVVRVYHEEKRKTPGVWDMFETRFSAEQYYKRHTLFPGPENEGKRAEIEQNWQRRMSSRRDKFEGSEILADLLFDPNNPGENKTWNGAQATAFRVSYAEHPGMLEFFQPRADEIRALLDRPDLSDDERRDFMKQVATHHAQYEGPSSAKVSFEQHLDKIFEGKKTLKGDSIAQRLASGGVLTESDRVYLILNGDKVTTAQVKELKQLFVGLRKRPEKLWVMQQVLTKAFNGRTLNDVLKEKVSTGDYHELSLFSELRVDQAPALTYLFQVAQQYETLKSSVHARQQAHPELEKELQVMFDTLNRYLEDLFRDFGGVPQGIALVKDAMQGKTPSQAAFASVNEPRKIQQHVDAYLHNAMRSKFMQFLVDKTGPENDEVRNAFREYMAAIPGGNPISIGNAFNKLTAATAHSQKISDDMRETVATFAMLVGIAPLGLGAPLGVAVGIAAAANGGVRFAAGAETREIVAGTLQGAAFTGFSALGAMWISSASVRGLTGMLEAYGKSLGSVSAIRIVDDLTEKGAFDSGPLGALKKAVGGVASLDNCGTAGLNLLVVLAALEIAEKFKKETKVQQNNQAPTGGGGEGSVQSGGRPAQGTTGQSRTVGAHQPGSSRTALSGGGLPVASTTPSSVQIVGGSPNIGVLAATSRSSGGVPSSTGRSAGGVASGSSSTGSVVSSNTASAGSSGVSSVVIEDVDQGFAGALASYLREFGPFLAAALKGIKTQVGTQDEYVSSLATILEALQPVVNESLAEAPSATDPVVVATTREAPAAPAAPGEPKPAVVSAPGPVSPAASKPPVPVVSRAAAETPVVAAPAPVAPKPAAASEPAEVRPATVAPASKFAAAPATKKRQQVTPRTPNVAAKALKDVAAQVELQKKAILDAVAGAGVPGAAQKNVEDFFKFLGLATDPPSQFVASWHLIEAWTGLKQAELAQRVVYGDKLFSIRDFEVLRTTLATQEATNKGAADLIGVRLSRTFDPSEVRFWVGEFNRDRSKSVARAVLIRASLLGVAHKNLPSELDKVFHRLFLEDPRLFANVAAQLHTDLDGQESRRLAPIIAEKMAATMKMGWTFAGDKQEIACLRQLKARNSALADAVIKELNEKHGISSASLAKKLSS